MTHEPVVTELRLPTKLGFEKVAMSTAASVAELMGFSCGRVEDLKTAVSEACVNAIEHGNRLNEALGVVVTLSIDDEALEIKVHDHGSGLQETPRRPDIDRKIGGEEDLRGMGMFLIHVLMDEVEYVTGTNGSFARLVIYLRGKGSNEYDFAN